MTSRSLAQRLGQQRAVFHGCPRLSWSIVLLKANVLRACLESHGLDVFLWGEHLGTAYVFWSVAAGGMRIQVPSGQVAQAQELIAAWERGELEVDEEPE